MESKDKCTCYDNDIGVMKCGYCKKAKMKQNNKKQSQKNKGSSNKSFLVLCFILLTIFIFIIGVFVGMVIQQVIIIKGIEKAGESWEGVISNMNVDIDINETKLVEATYDMFPELNQRGQR